MSKVQVSNEALLAFCAKYPKHIANIDTRPKNKKGVHAYHGACTALAYMLHKELGYSIKTNGADTFQRISRLLKKSNKSG